jgi:hypothetical protein
MVFSLCATTISNEIVVVKYSGSYVEALIQPDAAVSLLTHP